MTEDGQTLSSCIQRHTGSASTTILIGAAIVAIVILAFWIRISPLRALRRNPDEVFCCPDLVQILWEASNRSIDPCQDFYAYTCYSWDRFHKVTALGRVIFDNVTTATYTGLTGSRAAKVIAAYYRSCLGALSGEGSGLVRVVAALLGALKPQLRPTHRRMLQLVFRISLSYGMSSGLLITLQGAMHLNLSVESRLGWSMDETHRQRAVEVFNGFMHANVSWKAVKRYATALFLQDTCKCCLTSGVLVLTSIFPSSSLQEWEQELTARGHGLPRRVRHCNVSVLRRYSDIIITGDQPTALALLVVEASVNSWNSFYDKYTMEHQMNILCQPKAEDLGLLWDIVVMDIFGDPYKDNYVRRAYKAVSEQVILHAASIFPTDDVNVLRQVVSDYKVLLSTDLCLLDIEPPTPTDDYWRDELALKDYQSEVRRHQLQLGLPSYRYGAFREGTVITFSVTGIIFPPSVYPAIIDTALSDAAVNMPVIGSDAAHVMWLLIIASSQRLSQRSQEIIKSFTTCVSERDRLASARLSVQVLVNTSRASNWNKVIRSTGFADMSRYQFFYMSYVFLNLCGKRTISGVPTASYVRSVVSDTPDFYRAFGCPPPSNGSAHCSLEA